MAPPKLTHPHPRELGATRFFARLIAFDLECPRCGKVFQIRRLNKHKLAGYALDPDPQSNREILHHTWNPTTARFTCTGKDGCQKQFILGMLAWEPGKGARGTAIPLDQVPTYRQVGELRAEGQGHWMDFESKGRLSTSNITNSEERGEDYAEGEEEIE